MYALVQLRYLVPIERIDQSLAAHRAYLRQLKAERKLVASGPLEPRTAGVFLVRYQAEADLDAIIAGDPFHKEQLAAYSIQRWSPTVGKEDLDRI